MTKLVVTFVITSISPRLVAFEPCIETNVGTSFTSYIHIFGSRPFIQESYTELQITLTASLVKCTLRYWLAILQHMSCVHSFTTLSANRNMPMALPNSTSVMSYTQKKAEAGQLIGLVNQVDYPDVHVSCFRSNPKEVTIWQLETYTGLIVSSWL